MEPIIVLIISFTSLVTAQVSKYLFYSITTHSNQIKMLTSTGGMPSSHSALVSALTMSILLIEGANSYYFALAVVFSLIVVHDSMGVRYEASKHAIILNQMIDELPNDKQMAINKGKDLKELLGHKPKEALAGVLYGFVIAIIGTMIFRFWLHLI